MHSQKTEIRLSPEHKVIAGAMAWWVVETFYEAWQFNLRHIDWRWSIPLLAGYGLALLLVLSVWSRAKILGSLMVGLLVLNSVRLVERSLAPLPRIETPADREEDERILGIEKRPVDDR